MFYLICVWINGWVNNREAGDLKSHRTHYDVIAIQLCLILESPSHGWDTVGVRCGHFRMAIFRQSTAPPDKSIWINWPPYSWMYNLQNCMMSLWSYGAAKWCEYIGHTLEDPGKGLLSPMWRWECRQKHSEYTLVKRLDMLQFRFLTTHSP